MTLESPPRCPRCGAPQTTRGVSVDLCPACLLSAALSMNEEPCPYQIVAPMGEDSRGVTYLAEALAGGGGYMVLKVYGPRDDAEAVLSRYRQWKPAIDRIHHPNVSGLLDVGLTADGALYSVTGYAAGWPLSTWASKPPLGLDARREIVRQLAAGLDAAHRAGVAHLGIDSTKVRVTVSTGPRAMLLDLGSGLVFDGAACDFNIDRLGLTRLGLELGVEAWL